MIEIEHAAFKYASDEHTKIIDSEGSVFSLFRIGHELI